MRRFDFRTASLFLAGAAIILAATLLPGCGQAKQGPPGVAGNTGLQGPPGPTGSPGPAADMQAIQLCPDMPPAREFTEYLLRIGSEVFGVYSHGNSIFLAKLTAGNYATTDGRDCRFAISDSGEVLQ